MNRPSFTDCTVLLAESSEQTAVSTENILNSSGFPEAVHVEDIEAMRDSLAGASFDLLVTNARLDDRDVTPTLRDIRNGDLGGDSFMAIIALAQDPSSEDVAALMAGGVDIILTLPLSWGKMETALGNLLERRKPFVVTADYIGPDRRRSPRTDSGEVRKTVVPNALKRKATGQDDAGDAPEILDSINNQRVESLISRITFGVGKITGLTDGVEEGTLDGWLTELRDLATQLSNRIAKTRYVHQAALCHSLTEITSQFGDGGELKAQDTELLQQIALGLEIAVKQSDDSTVHAAQDIEALIEGAVGRPKATTGDTASTAEDDGKQTAES